MTIQPISLGLRSNPGRFPHEGAARLINCYAEELGEDAKAPWGLHCVDGLADLATLPSASGGVRALLALTDADLYAVAGRLLYRIDTGGAVTTLGGIASDGLVTMARNRASPPVIAIVCDGLVYYCQAGVVTQSTDADLPPPISVAALDGYFSFLTADGRHFASDLDSTDVNSLSYATAESNPDGGVRNWTRGRDLVIGGNWSIEFWQNVGGDPYPFQRTTAIDVGVLAAGSVAAVYETSAFVAHDNTVRLLKGYEAVQISTHEVGRLIATESDPTTITACSWSSRGHTFYALSGSSWTRVYDLATGKWHDRESYGLGRWRGERALQWGTQRVVGDYAEGALYTLDPDTHTEAGEHLIMTVQTPPVHAFPYRLCHHTLYVDVVPGVGLVSSTDSLASPEMMLRHSDDGGRSWGTERTAPIGSAGDNLRRVRFNRLGTARSRTYQLSVSAAVARGIISASVDIERLRA